jgi:hypothetical protein
MMYKKQPRRSYSYWTSKEVRMLMNGQKPETHSVSQCRAKAHTMGIPFKLGHSNRWKPEEITKARNGEVPEGRTWAATVAFCRQHRIPLTGALTATVNVGVPTCTKAEANLLKKDIIPPGWSINQCYYACRTHLGKGFKPGKQKRTAEFSRKVKIILEYLSTGMTYREIGEKLNISRQRVLQILVNCYAAIGQKMCKTLSVDEVIKTYEESRDNEWQLK